MCPAGITGWACTSATRACCQLVRRRCAGAVVKSLRGPLCALQARQRLGFRLQKKDKQLAKLQGVVRELECKLIEAHKRQADL